MLAHKIVVDEMQVHRRVEVIQLFRKAVGKPAKNNGGNDGNNAQNNGGNHDPIRQAQVKLCVVVARESPVLCRAAYGRDHRAG